MENRTRRRATHEQIAIIQRCEGSCREVAAAVGVGKTTVWRYRQAVYDLFDANESDSDAEESIIPFERLAEPRRCSVHGLTHVWPCVQCAAKLADFE